MHEFRLLPSIFMHKSKALADLYGRHSHTLIRANARAILTHSYSHLVQQVDELCVIVCIVCGICVNISCRLKIYTELDRK